MSQKFANDVECQRWIRKTVEFSGKARQKWKKQNLTCGMKIKG